MDATAPSADLTQTYQSLRQPLLAYLRRLVGDAQSARARVGANVVFWSWLFHEAILRICGEVTLPALRAGRVTSPTIFRGDR